MGCGCGGSRQAAEKAAAARQQSASEPPALVGGLPPSAYWNGPKTSADVARQKNGPKPKQ